MGSKKFLLSQHRFVRKKTAEPGTQLMNDILASNQGYERGGDIQRNIRYDYYF